jgi:hypothetical protein
VERAVQTLTPAYFDRIYATNPDPWRFDSSAYELSKYALTLEALSRERYPRALEIGCSITAAIFPTETHRRIIIPIRPSPGGEGRLHSRGSEIHLRKKIRQRVDRPPQRVLISPIVLSSLPCSSSFPSSVVRTRTTRHPACVFENCVADHHHLRRRRRHMSGTRHAVNPIIVLRGRMGNCVLAVLRRLALEIHKLRNHPRVIEQANLPRIEQGQQLAIEIRACFLRRGVLWDDYRAYYGKAGSSTLVWQADAYGDEATSSMLPGIDAIASAGSYWIPCLRNCSLGHSPPYLSPRTVETR